MDIPAFIILILIVAAILLTAYVFIKSNRKKFSESDQKFIKKTWQRIVKMANGDPNHAILEADKLLNHTLTLKGYDGSVGDQLKAASFLFTNINDVWQAHKARNQLAHEIGKKISIKESKSYLIIFKKALKDLGAKL